MGRLVLLVCCALAACGDATAPGHESPLAAVRPSPERVDGGGAAKDDDIVCDPLFYVTRQFILNPQRYGDTIWWEQSEPWAWPRRSLWRKRLDAWWPERVTYLDTDYGTVFDLKDGYAYFAKREPSTGDPDSVFEQPWRLSLRTGNKERFRSIPVGLRGMHPRGDAVYLISHEGHELIKAPKNGAPATTLTDIFADRYDLERVEDFLWRGRLIVVANPYRRDGKRTALAVSTATGEIARLFDFKAPANGPGGKARVLFVGEELYAVVPARAYQPLCRRVGKRCVPLFEQWVWTDIGRVEKNHIYGWVAPAGDPEKKPVCMLFSPPERPPQLVADVECREPGIAPSFSWESSEPNQLTLAGRGMAACRAAKRITFRARAAWIVMELARLWEESRLATEPPKPFVAMRLPPEMAGNEWWCTSSKKIWNVCYRTRVLCEEDVQLDLGREPCRRQDRAACMVFFGDAGCMAKMSDCLSERKTMLYRSGLNADYERPSHQLPQCTMIGESD